MKHTKIRDWRALKSLRLPSWARPNHPILRRELRQWRRANWMKFTHWGCLLSLLAVLISITGSCSCCGLVITVDAGDDPITWLGYSLIGFGLSLWMVDWLGQWGLSMAATVLTAPRLSAEIEDRTWDMMRLTTMPASEIVMAKWAAALWQLRWLTLALSLLRLLLLLLFSLFGALIALVWLWAAHTGGPTMQALIAFVVRPGPFLWLALIVIWIGWSIYYLLQPVLKIMTGGAFGLFASSLAPSKSMAIVVAFAVRLAAGIITWIMMQSFGAGGNTLALLLLPLVGLFGNTSSGVTVPSLMAGLSLQLGAVGIASAAVLMMGVMAAIHLGLTWLLLTLATARATVMGGK